MAFNEQEQAIIKYGVENKKTRQEVEKALLNYRLGIKPEQKPTEQAPKKGTEQAPPKKTTGIVKDTVGDVKETAQAIGGQFKTTTDRLSDKYIDKDYTVADKILATGSEMFKLGSRSFGELIIGAGKVSLSEKNEERVRQLASQVGETVADSIMVQNTVTAVMDKWNKLPAEQKKMWGNIGGFAEGGVDLLTLGLANKLLVRPVKNIFKKVATETIKQADEIVEAGVKQTVKTGVKEVVEDGAVEAGTSAGLIQKGKELAQRLPRVVERIDEGIKEAAERSTKIKQSSPAVAKAIEVNVPEKTINIVTGADAPTVRDMNKMYDIVTSKSDTRPSVVAGEAASNQYTLINAKRKEVGAQLGEAIKALPDTKVDISQGLKQLDEMFVKNGAVLINGKITRNSFDATSYTKQQVDAIMRLYENAQRGITDNIIDAKTIQAKDSLFSKLQREDKLVQKIEDIYVEFGDEVMPAHTAFRNVFRTQLDMLSPEISKLNKEYALYRQFVDDMDDTIFKHSKINLALDPADSAAINLRRIESNALSQPAFQEVVEQMNVIAKQLGYEGSNPADLIRFSLELDAMFPDKIGKASFAGGIRVASGGDLPIGSRFYGYPLQILKSMGSPSIKDQQKALKAMLEELLSGQKKVRDIKQTIDLTPSNKTSDFDATKQGGYIKNPLVRENIESYKPSNPRGRNINTEAEAALKKYPNGDEDALQVLTQYTTNRGGGGITRTEAATAIDILNGKAKPKSFNVGAKTPNNLNNLTTSIQKAKASGQSFDEWVKGQEIPQDLLYLSKQADGVSYETFKRNLVRNIGSVDGKEKIPDDVAQSVFERLQKTAQRGEFGDESTLFKDVGGRNPQRLTGEETVTVYRATPVNNLRAGDFVSPDKTEAGFYTSATKKIYPFEVKKSDLVSVEGSMGGGQELIYIPKGSRQGIAKEYFKTPKEFWESVNNKTRSQLKAEWDSVK